MRFRIACTIAALCALPTAFPFPASGDTAALDAPAQIVIGTAAPANEDYSDWTAYPNLPDLQFRVKLGEVGENRKRFWFWQFRNLAAQPRAFLFGMSTTRSVSLKRHYRLDAKQTMEWASGDYLEDGQALYSAAQPEVVPPAATPPAAPENAPPDTGQKTKPAENGAAPPPTADGDTGTAPPTDPDAGSRSTPPNSNADVNRASSGDRGGMGTPRVKWEWRKLQTLVELLQALFSRASGEHGSRAVTQSLGLLQQFMDVAWQTGESGKTAAMGKMIGQYTDALQMTYSRREASRQKGRAQAQETLQQLNRVAANPSLLARVNSAGALPPPTGELPSPAWEPTPEERAGGPYTGPHAQTANALLKFAPDFAGPARADAAARKAAAQKKLTAVVQQLSQWIPQLGAEENQNAASHVTDLLRQMQTLAPQVDGGPNGPTAKLVDQTRDALSDSLAEGDSTRLANTLQQFPAG